MLKEWLVIDPQEDWDFDRVRGDFDTEEMARREAHASISHLRKPMVVARVVSTLLLPPELQETEG